MRGRPAKWWGCASLNATSHHAHPGDAVRVRVRVGRVKVRGVVTMLIQVTWLGSTARGKKESAATWLGFGFGLGSGSGSGSGRGRWRGRGAEGVRVGLR